MRNVIDYNEYIWAMSCLKNSQKRPRGNSETWERYATRDCYDEKLTWNAKMRDLTLPDVRSGTFTFRPMQNRAGLLKKLENGSMIVSKAKREFLF